MGFFITFFVSAWLYIMVEMIKPKPDLENAKPASLGDVNFPTATEGRVIPILWGTARIEGPNLVWYGDYVKEAVTESVRTGLFSKSRRVKAYRYKIGLQFAPCLGVVDSLLKVYNGDDLVLDRTSSPVTHNTTFTIDKPDLYGGEDQGAGGLRGTMRFFAGTRPQEASLYMAGSNVRFASVANGGSGYSIGDILTEDGDGTASIRATWRVVFAISELGNAVLLIAKVTSGSYTTQSSSPAATTVSPAGGTGCTLNLEYQGPFQGVGGKSPRYHDVCHMLPDTDPIEIGLRPSLEPWGFELRRVVACNYLGLSGGQENVDGGANPMNVLYEVLTDKQWGLGDQIETSDIDTANFIAAAETLFDEGNGFSFLLDRQEDHDDMLERVIRQIDAVLFKNIFTGKFQVRLTRADYNPNTVPEINASNLVRVPVWNGGTWEGLINNLYVPVALAEDNYRSTFGFAQDMAGTFIVGANITSQVRHPGVKTGQLANDIAWRDLRSLAVPFFQGVIVVTRDLYGTLPGDVLALTDEDLGLVRLPVRVKNVDYGSLLEDEITLEVVQDVFFGARGSFGDQSQGDWEEPSDTHDPYPIDEQLAFEAPRALTLRDPDSPSPETDKLFAAARKQGNEVSFLMMQRNDTVTPSGAFVEAGEAYGFMLIGGLQSALDVGSAYPLVSMIVTPLPDSQTDLVEAFTSLGTLTPTDIGTELLTLCLIDDEFILVEMAGVSGANVQLVNVYRGVLDSVQAPHAAGSFVYLMFVGSNISDDVIPAGNVVEVKLLPRSTTETLDIGDATAVSFAMEDRTRRPYPPASFRLNGVYFDATNVDLDGSGAGEDVGILVDQIVRRDFRVTDELPQLSTDAGALFSDFPTANSTEVEIEVRNGVTVLTMTTGISGTSATIRQLDILEGLDQTPLPASLTIALRQSHTFQGTVYKSRYWLELTFTVDSALVGKHAFGVLDDSEVSTIYEVQSGDDGTDHVFTLSTAFTVGDVEYRLDGGSWTTLITAGMTSGSIPNASLSVGTDIEVRHLSTDTDPQKLLTMTVSGTPEAYAVLVS